MNNEQYALLGKKISASDDWSNGVFCALVDVLHVLSRELPSVVRELEPQWQKAAERYNTLPDDSEEAQRLEARKILFGMLTSDGTFDRVRHRKADTCRYDE